MQAVMQFMKISSSATQNMQPRSVARAANEKKAGWRFLDFLMVALSASAV